MTAEDKQCRGSGARGTRRFYAIYRPVHAARGPAPILGRFIGLALRDNLRVVGTLARSRGSLRHRTRHFTLLHRGSSN